jgi:hypothetical protein
MTQSRSFIFSRLSSICTSASAQIGGAESIRKSLIAERLSGAARPAINAAAVKIHKPIPVPVGQYVNFLLQAADMSHRANKIISKADTDRLYMLLLRFIGWSGWIDGLSVSVVRRAIMQR